MKKLAVLINGVSAPIKDDYFWIEWLSEWGYEVQRIEPLRQETVAMVTKTPDLIIGWSMGGLMAPILAERYPMAKLILVATGVKVEPGEAMAKMVFEMVGKEWGMKLLGVGLQLPKKLLVDTYEQLNKVPDPSLKEKYRQQMSVNIDMFRSLPEKYLNELILFLKVVDNTEMLKNIMNKTLVMSGNKDNLMTLDSGKKLASLIKNSQFVSTMGGHYNVIGSSEKMVIKKFLE